VDQLEGIVYIYIYEKILGKRRGVDKLFVLKQMLQTGKLMPLQEYKFMVYTIPIANSTLL